MKVEDGVQRWREGGTLTNPLMYWEGPGGGRVPENGRGAFSNLHFSAFHCTSKYFELHNGDGIKS